MKINLDKMEDFYKHREVDFDYVLQVAESKTFFQFIKHAKIISNTQNRQLSLALPVFAFMLFLLLPRTFFIFYIGIPLAVVYNILALSFFQKDEPYDEARHMFNPKFKSRVKAYFYNRKIKKYEKIIESQELKSLVKEIPDFHIKYPNIAVKLNSIDNKGLYDSLVGISIYLHLTKADNLNVYYNLFRDKIDNIYKTISLDFTIYNPEDIHDIKLPTDSMFNSESIVADLVIPKSFLDIYINAESKNNLMALDVFKKYEMTFSVIHKLMSYKSPKVFSEEILNEIFTSLDNFEKDLKITYMSSDLEFNTNEHGLNALLEVMRIQNISEPIQKEGNL